VPAAIESVTPGRGRSGAAVSLLGSGFSATPGQNVVTVGGLPAAVTADAVAQVDVTVPGGVATDQHLEVVLTNLDDASTSTWWWWSKATVLALATAVVPFKQPFVDEIDRAFPDDPRVALATQFERWAAKLELVPKDLLILKGALFAGSSAGAVQVAPGLLGQVLSSLPSGAAFATRAPVTLQWGRFLAAATVAATLMEAGARDTEAVVQATEEVAVFAGEIVSLSIFGSVAGFSRVMTLELLVNGVVVQTYLPRQGFGVGNNQYDTFFPGTAVAQGDRIEVRITKPNAVSAGSWRAMAQVV